VWLEQLPEGGFAFNATVSAPGTLTVESIEVQTQVAASTIEDDQVRLNGASTIESGEVAIAKLTLAEANPPVEGWGLTVHELADTSGDPIGLAPTNATPTSASNAARSNATGEASSAPGLGAGAVIATAIAAAIGAARRR
jgi:hypothetical protein